MRARARTRTRAWGCGYGDRIWVERTEQHDIPAMGRATAFDN